MIEHFYESIEGWFDFQDLYSEAVAWAQDGAQFVEVGSWFGRSTAYLATEIANSGKNIRLYAVDTWKGAASDAAGMAHTVAQHGGSVKEVFLANIKPVHDYVVPVEKTSSEAAATFENKSLDFVFIDADHFYESVVADIKAWLPKVKPGGVLAGHDYLNARGYGVIQAVNELLPGHTVRNPSCSKPLAASWEFVVPVD